MIEFRTAVKLKGKNNLYIGGGEISPSMSKELSDIVQKNINIRFQRLMSEFLHKFITGKRKDFIKMYVDFAKAEMRRRNQTGTGKTLKKLESASNLISFKQMIKPVIGVSLNINVDSAKEFFKYAMTDENGATFQKNYYQPQEIEDWIRRKGFKYTRRKDRNTGRYKYEKADPEEIASVMFRQKSPSTKKIYKVKNIGGSVRWSQLLGEEPKTAFEDIQYDFEEGFYSEFENSLTAFFNSKKIRVFQNKRGK